MKNIYSNIKIFICMLLTIIPISVYSYSPFYNYLSTVGISDILFDESYIWVTTKGGLMRIKQDNYDIKHYNNNEYIPDLQLTSLCKDSSGSIWIGSRKGYLYQLTKRGRINKYDSYIVSAEPGKWRINDMLSYKKYLIIGAKSGLSIFDTEAKNTPINAMSFNGLKPPVYAVFVFKDSLYVSLKEGIAKLDISGNNIQTKNFADEGIWISEKDNSEIKYFPVLNDSIHYYKEIAAVWKDTILHCKDSIVYRDTTVICSVSSTITSLKIDRDDNLWIGTVEDYVYKWDGNNLLQFKTNGLTFNNINRVYVDRKSKIWCTPKVNKNIETQEIPWWQGVASFNLKKWFLYNKTNSYNFGSLGDGNDFFGVCEDKFGNMWFGTNGSNVKKYNTKKKSWDKYFIGGANKSSTFKLIPKQKGLGWGKCDAIARDSSGWMWFSAYKGDKGSILCYNPEDYKPDNSSFRYFFPKDTEYYFLSPLCINIDVTGKVFVGGDGQLDNGKLIVFDHSGDPINDGINTPLYDGTFGKVWDMASVVSSVDSGTWIATEQGLYHYQYHNKEGSIITLVNDLTTEKPTSKATCVEVERTTRSIFTNFNGNISGDSAIIYSVLWIGTQLNGLAQVFTHLIVNSDGVIVKGEVDSIKMFNEDEDGLANNSINHIAMDNKNGYLWIATEGGLSRYFLGHSSKKLENNVKITAYPNPFIHSRHREIIFENLAPGSSVSIYSIDGRLVANIVDIGNNVRKTVNQWTYFWKPDPRIIPGTYFYTANIQPSYENKKERANVGKILILP